MSFRIRDVAGVAAALAVDRGSATSVPVGHCAGQRHDHRPRCSRDPPPGAPLVPLVPGVFDDVAQLKAHQRLAS
jgi:hypothetical protein